MPKRPRLTYANIVSTLALFLALGGGAAYAASKVGSNDLAKGAVHTRNVFKRAITSGKLAVGAVRSNQIVDGAVGSPQLANGAVGSKQLAAAAVAPSNLEFPVFYAASPSGGSASATEAPAPYPIADGTWSQKPGEINVVFGEAVGTLAYDESGSGSCQVFFEVSINGQPVGGGAISTSSITPQRVGQSVGAQPQIDPVAPITNHLTVLTNSNGHCTPDSTIDSARFRVLDFG